MRVISGSAGGIPLSVPAQVVRPTMDKVRAAIFSSLGDGVPGARVLDLFAGSGSLGIEALSRGAETAVFVDADRAAAECIRRNLAKTRLQASVQIMDAFRFLRLYTEADSLNLIFADPPYRKTSDDADFATALLQCGDLHASLVFGGTFILETERSFEIDAALDAQWQLLRSRSYGDSAVHFITPA